MTSPEVKQIEKIAEIWDDLFDLTVYSDGRIEYRLGNLTDAGWYWDGKSEDKMFLLYLARLSCATGGVKEDWIRKYQEEIESNPEAKRVVERIFNDEKGDPDALEGVVYNLAGDNRCFRFGECYWDPTNDEYMLYDYVSETPFIKEWVESKNDSSAAEDILDECIKDFSLPGLDDYSIDEVYDRALNELIDVVKEQIASYKTPVDFVENWCRDRDSLIEEAGGTLEAAAWDLIDEIMRKNEEEIISFLDENYEAKRSNIIDKEE